MSPGVSQADVRFKIISCKKKEIPQLRIIEGKCYKVPEREECSIPVLPLVRTLSLLVERIMGILLRDRDKSSILGSAH